jgi:diphosphomevalonate decarboxylase
VKKNEMIQIILGDRLTHEPVNHSAQAFAPTNIALCKYWGKRDPALNLPVTGSLSISLAEYGATVQLEVTHRVRDEIILNGEGVDPASSFTKRLVDFLNLFRSHRSQYFRITIQSSVPIAAGLASSACGFASIIKALDVLYGWNLPVNQLSMLARLGSGSACRSLWDGFVEWYKGERTDGMDSYAERLAVNWPEFTLGLLLVDKKEKRVSSREAMQRTVETSGAYKLWPQRANLDLLKLKRAIAEKDFHLLGETAEANAMMMHAMMLVSQPSIHYSTPETLALMQKIWNLRKEGLPVYFTQDAGPNLKLLFLAENVRLIEAAFTHVQVVKPFYC